MDFCPFNTYDNFVCLPNIVTFYVSSKKYKSLSIDLNNMKIKVMFSYLKYIMSYLLLKNHLNVKHECFNLFKKNKLCSYVNPCYKKNILNKK